MEFKKNELKKKSQPTKFENTFTLSLKTAHRNTTLECRFPPILSALEVIFHYRVGTIFGYVHFIAVIDTAGTVFFFFYYM